jgi:hypothetical protein
VFGGRIAAPPPPAGISEGQAWGIVNAAIAPGPWIDLALGTTFVAAANYYLPGFRVEGDLVRFRGRLLVAAGQSYAASALIDTLPESHRPSGQVQVGASWTSGATRIQVTTGGLVTCIAALSAGQFVGLDGLTFTR